MESHYYDPEVETATRDQIRKLQGKKLKKVIQHAWNHSPFYRKKFDEANVNPDQIRTLDDIHKLPFVTKEDLRKNQEAFPPGESC